MNPDEAEQIRRLHPVHKPDVAWGSLTWLTVIALAATLTGYCIFVAIRYLHRTLSPH